MQDDLAMRALADHREITDLIYRYCRSVDRLDIPLGHSIWHDGGTADYGELYEGPGPGVIDLICRQHEHTLHHSHQVTNILIALDGEQAGSEAYCTATLRLRDGQAIRQISVWSRYLDQWSRRDGRWGLDHRQAVIDFDEIREVTPMAEHQVGRRDRQDPSYRCLP
ncbi:nuclear transport factor 2 family protein [Mangrovimicrobium sediminis]|nr:nuclear transport factor 2 family protein [Haliea sp. SAOS-164]